MKILEVMSNKDTYISPEDEVAIYYEIDSLMEIWKKVLIPFSDKKYSQLNDESKILIDKIQKLSKGADLSIGKSYDYNVVELICYGSTIINRVDAINEIVQKTKNAVPTYFYHQTFVMTYYQMGYYDKAIEIIDHMFKKNQNAYYYIITKYYSGNYSNYQFREKLENYKIKSIAKLLDNGESIQITLTKDLAIQIGELLKKEG